MLYSIVFLVVLNVLLVVTATQTKVTCRDEEGREVDWFYIYKLPKNHKKNSLEKDGTEGLHYLYITSENYDAWQFSRTQINASDSMPAQTLQPLFDDQTVLLLAYNDEYPDGTTMLSLGHTKGVVATNGDLGLWLVHSVPKYPTIPRYEYPKTGELYGQSFLCMSLKGEEMNKVGQQLIFNEPHIYYKRLPVALNGRFPSLEAAIKEEWLHAPPFNSVVELMTSGGTKFKSFAKGHRFGRELYEDWLAPELDVNLLVETWRNGHGNMASNCSKNDKVYNIEEIKEPKLQISFETKQDHSKWAVSQESGFKLFRWRLGSAGSWICVGDINRQEHQLERGGGVVCQRNPKITNLYRNMISSYEPCEKNTRKGLFSDLLRKASMLS